MYKQNQDIFDYKLSVVIPVYNTKAYLEKCLDSVLQQTLKEIEIICINDASTDKSLKILENYQRKYLRVKIINNEENKGQGYSRNKAIQLSRGKYIYFLDSDDWIEPNSLEKLYNKIEDTKADCIIGECIAFSQDSKNKKRERELNKWLKIQNFETSICSSTDIENYYKIFPNMACNKLYLKSFLINNKISFIDTFCWHEDDGFWIKFLANSPKIGLLDYKCYHYRIHSNSTCAKSKKSKKLQRFYYKKSLDDAIVYAEKNKLQEIIPFINSLILLNESTKMNFFYRTPKDTYLKIFNFKIFRIKYKSEKGKFLVKFLGIPLFYLDRFK